MTWFLVQQRPNLQVLPTIPLSIGGLIFWVDASDASTITLSGSNVTQMLDKSPSKIITTQVTAAKQPTLVVAGQNGLNTIRFTAASSQELVFSSNINVGTTYTLFSVYKRSALGTSGIALGSATTNFVGNMYYLDNNLYVQNSSGYYSGTPPNNAIYNIITSVLTASTGVARFNGAGVTVGFTANAYTGIFVNIGNASGALYSDATVAEIILYASALGNSDMLSVEAYLKAKWATP